MAALSAQQLPQDLPNVHTVDILMTLPMISSAHIQISQMPLLAL
jgi:hypothetical protein